MSEGQIDKPDEVELVGASAVELANSQRGCHHLNNVGVAVRHDTTPATDTILSSPTMTANLRDSMRYYCMRANKICGLWRGWLLVVRRERGSIDWAAMVRLLLTARRVGGRDFRLRYRACCRCVVFDRSLRRCRPWDKARVGCGCFMPFKIHFGGGCWLRETGGRSPWPD